MPKILKEDEVDFIKLNYSSFGAKKCSEILGRKQSTIHACAQRFGLKVEKGVSSMIKSKAARDYHNTLSKNIQFKEGFTPESSYLLGYAWADGCLPTGRTGLIISTTPPDDKNLDIICPLTSDNWKKTQVPSKNGWSDKITYRLNDTDLGHRLFELGYGPGRTTYPEILNKLPESLHIYWFRGLIDGDGCWYFNNKHKLRQFQITSNINQNWDFVEEFFKNSNVEYTIDRRIVCEGTKSRSNIRVFGHSNILRLGDLIYDTFREDKIGLERKYQKWLECISIKDHRPTRGKLSLPELEKILFYTS